MRALFYFSTTVVNHEPRAKAAALTVRARAVVVSGGAINTPAILLRSGLKHPMIGRHLCLHPVLVVGGVFPEDYGDDHDHDDDRGDSDRGVRQESQDASQRATAATGSISAATAATGKQVGGFESNEMEWVFRTGSVVGEKKLLMYNIRFLLISCVDR